MKSLLDLLHKKKRLISDGAWGTQLQNKGLPVGTAPELWNVDNPKAVIAVAEEYAKAGSDIVLTNTFGGSRIKLNKEKLGHRVEELNIVGAKNSCIGAPDCFIAGL